MKRFIPLAFLLLTAQAPAREHWAEINASGVVQRVIVADEAFIRSGAVGKPENWVRTYKDRSGRKNYAAPGFMYDPQRDVFIPPKPYPSWTLRETTAQWDAPKEMPSTGGPYKWSEQKGDWEDANRLTADQATEIKN